MQEKKSYALWLPAWYPNELEPLAGDFLQRHARSVALYMPVVVIHVIRDKRGFVTRNRKKVEKSEGLLTEKTLYYYSPSYKWKAFEKLLSFFRYRSILQEEIKKQVESSGLPILSHVHILSKNALMAVWMKKKFSVPFVVSEQWTIYLKEAKPNLSSLPFYLLYFMRWVLRRADDVSVVSKYLGEAIRSFCPPVNYTVIPNVVDEKTFYPGGKKMPEGKRFIHISNLNYQKNFEDILLAFAQVKDKNPYFFLDIFGPHQAHHISLAEEIGLQAYVFFHGEVSHQVLAEAMRNADALVLYSRYETFGCVLIEANASGIPVISSDLPVIRETIEENTGGYLVPGEQPRQLAQKIDWFMQLEVDSLPEKIKLAERTAERFSNRVVGKAFVSWYQKVLAKQ